MLDDDTSKAGRRSEDIEFWKAEYVKRKFYIDNKEEYCELEREYLEIAKPIVDSSLGEIEKKVGLIQMQLSAECLFFGYDPPSYSVAMLMPMIKMMSDRYQCILKKLIEVSKKYQYYAVYLFEKCNAEELIRKIKNEEPLPLGPMTHHDGKNHDKMSDDENLLLLRVGDNSKISADDYKKNWLKYYPPQKTYYPYNIPVKIHGQEYFDFIVAGKISGNCFDYDEAIKQIQNHIVITVYNAKKNANISLTDGEMKALNNAFKRFAGGQYREGSAMGRAIGLWLWDYIDNNKNVSKASAIKKSRELGLSDAYKASSDRVLERFFDVTDRCIKKGEVLPVK